MSRLRAMTARLRAASVYVQLPENADEKKKHTRTLQDAERSLAQARLPGLCSAPTPAWSPLI